MNDILDQHCLDNNGFCLLGISYVENGLYEDALVAYLKANGLTPNNEKITFNLGNLVRISIGISKIWFYFSSFNWICSTYEWEIYRWLKECLEKESKSTLDRNVLISI